VVGEEVDYEILLSVKVSVITKFNQYFKLSSHLSLSVSTSVSVS